MAKVRFIQKKSRTDIDFTLWGVTYWDEPSMVYLNESVIPDVAKQFMLENTPKVSQEGNIKSWVYGNMENYSFADIVRTER